MISSVIKFKWDKHVHMPSTYLHIRDTLIMIIIIFFNGATTNCVSLFNLQFFSSHSTSLPILAFWPYTPPRNTESTPQFYDQPLLFSYKQ